MSLVPGIASSRAFTTSTADASTERRVEISRQLATVAIIGCGNSARALACYLSAKGHPVHIVVRSLESVSDIRERKTLRASGKIEGNFPIHLVTADPLAGIAEANTIFVATVTTAYEEVARKLAPHLHAGQQIVLFSSKFCGVVHFTKILQQCGAPEVSVIETDALFACRTQDDGSIWIRGFKDWTLFSSVNRTQTTQQSSSLLDFFPGLQAADNVVQRGLTDFGALTHALTMLCNMNKIDRGESFLFYVDGFTERTIAMLERMEQEFAAVAEAYNTSLIPMTELLNRYYGCDTSSLLAAMRSVPNYKISQSPPALRHRYIEEDVSCSLVPISQLAKKAWVDTPIIDAVIQLASTILNAEFYDEGRNLKALGWEHLTHAQIVQAING